ncbi:CU044_5270 family protein [Streptomyces bluensis]|uniref:CU044_5270 family protein n=1 Tax=Streptomyces bluensis TaxID=33897 RepID=UPI00331A4F0F
MNQLPKLPKLPKLQELPELSELPERDLPPGRHLLLKEHLMTEIRQETQHAAPATTPARSRSGSRSRWLRPALAAAAVATAAAVTFTVLPSSDDSGQAGRPAASQQAVQLLENIALAAEHADVPTDIRDDQFVYIRSKGAYTVRENDGPGKRGPVRDREIWLSVDGTHPGLLDDDRDGVGRTTLESSPLPDTERSKPEFSRREDTGRETDYRALSKLPTDPDKMRDWLYRVSADQVEKERPDKDYAAFVLFGDLIHESLMPPKVSAALYRAAAQIPGVKVVPNVKDPTGREGIAITRQQSGKGREEQIFDAKTFMYLGEREIDENGKVTGMSAVLERAVVDKAGQRP